jgi:hypothetical protein
MEVFSHGGIIALVSWVLETQPTDLHLYKWALVVGHRWVLVLLTQQPFVVMEVFSHGGIMVVVSWVLETQPTDLHPFKWVLVVGHK